MSFRDMLTVISWHWIMMLSTHSVPLPLLLPLLPACLAVHSDSSPVFSPFLLPAPGKGKRELGKVKNWLCDGALRRKKRNGKGWLGVACLPRIATILGCVWAPLLSLHYEWTGPLMPFSHGISFVQIAFSLSAYAMSPSLYSLKRLP